MGRCFCGYNPHEKDLFCLLHFYANAVAKDAKGRVLLLDGHADLHDHGAFGKDRRSNPCGDMLEEIDLAYAVTVHKSQGSEFPAVIIPVLNFPPMLMTRNLLYTAVTRGKKLVIIVGDPGRVRSMIDNNRADGRYTGLKSRLISLDSDPFGRY